MFVIWNAELFQQYFLPLHYTHLQIVIAVLYYHRFNHAFYEQCDSRDFMELIYHCDFGRKSTLKSAR